jgi:ribokinase
MNSKKPIVVVGSINVDLVATAEYIPAPGETISGSSFQIHSGGKGANQAVAIARLGYPVSLIGCIGEDAFGTQLRPAWRMNRSTSRW